jgi:hypothetical protein
VVVWWPPPSLLAVVVVWWVKEKVSGSAAAAYASLHKWKRPQGVFPTTVTTRPGKYRTIA